MKRLKGKRIKYTAEHLEFLKIGYATMSVRYLARAFNTEFDLAKTVGAIASALTVHRITCGRKGSDRLAPLRLYTPEQVQFLRENYTSRSRAELTAVFNSRFGTDKTKKQITAATGNRKITSGLTGRFRKGHLPWNTGTKGQRLTTANSGSFKKGDIPPNRKPLGSERIDNRDGRTLVKIAERNPYTGFPTRYKHKHVHIWEQTNGPVPDGMVIAFRDGKRTNCDPANLMLISRAELLHLNRNGYKNVPETLKPSLLALVRLILKTSELARQKTRRK